MKNISEALGKIVPEYKLCNCGNAPAVLCRSVACGSATLGAAEGMAEYIATGECPSFRKKLEFYESKMAEHRVRVTTGPDGREYVEELDGDGRVVRSGGSRELEVWRVS